MEKWTDRDHQNNQAASQRHRHERERMLWLDSLRAPDKPTEIDSDVSDREIAWATREAIRECLDVWPNSDAATEAIRRDVIRERKAERKDPSLVAIHTARHEHEYAEIAAEAAAEMAEAEAARVAAREAARPKRALIMDPEHISKRAYHAARKARIAQGLPSRGTKPRTVMDKEARRAKRNLYAKLWHQRHRAGLPTALLRPGRGGGRPKVKKETP